MAEQNLKAQLDRIEQLLIAQKEVLDFNEMIEYTGLSPSYGYKLTSRNEIPCYCPTGKKLYFNRKELDAWMQRNRRATNEEIESEAATHVTNNPK